MSTPRIIAFSPAARGANWQEAVYTLPDEPRTVYMPVEGYLTVETEDGERLVLAAVLRSDGRLVTAESLAINGRTVYFQSRVTNYYAPDQS